MRKPSLSSKGERRREQKGGKEGGKKREGGNKPECRASAARVIYVCNGMCSRNDIRALLVLWSRKVASNTATTVEKHFLGAKSTLVHCYQSQNKHCNNHPLCMCAVPPSPLRPFFFSRASVKTGLVRRRTQGHCCDVVSFAWEKGG